jgi:hypothetical protein
VARFSLSAPAPASVAPTLSPARQAVADLRALADRLIPSDATEPLGVYAGRANDPAAGLALYLERTVLSEAVGDRASQLIAGYAPYQPASLLVCVVDQRRRLPAAMMRIVFPSKAGLKSLNDIETVWGTRHDRMFTSAGLDYDPNHTWDIATMAIAADYRTTAFQGAITMALCQTISVLGARLGFHTSVAILHVPVLRMLQWKLYRPFTEIDGFDPRPYLDSTASLPARLVLSEWHRRLAQRDQVLHTMMTEGSGLEPALRSLVFEDAAELAAEVSALADLRLHLR